MSDNLPFVIFDGDCAFCNKSVTLILKKDKTQKIQVCSNQSRKGKYLIEKHKIKEDLNATIVYIENNNVYFKSTAALKISKKLKGGYPMLSGFLIFPKCFRDSVYDLIAKYRKQIIKGSYSCEMITDETIKKRIHT